MLRLIFLYSFIINSCVNSNHINVSLNEPEPLNVLTNFLKNFEDFHIIFHANSTSIHFANELLKALKSNTYHVYKNYLAMTDYKRENLSNILNIVLTEDATAWGSFNNSNKLNHRDVVLFVFTNDNFLTKLLKDGVTVIKIAGNILALQIINHSAMMYRICYFCGIDSLKSVLIYSSNNTKNYADEHLKELLLPNNFKDLNGQVLNIIYVQYFPFAYCKFPVNEIFINNRRIVSCTATAGVESKLVKIMSKKLNFSYLVHTLDSNGSFFDMIKYVNKNLADFAFGGISITEERMSLIQFSDQFNSEDYVFLYRLQLDFRQVFNKFVKPFHDKIVWLLFYISYIICCFLLYVYSWVNKKVKVPGIRYVLWLLLHTPIEQSTSWAKILSSYTGVTSTITLGLWWWICLIISTLYKSSILSTMIHPLNTEPDSLHDLVVNDFTIVGNIYYKDIITEMLDINDANFKRALMTTSFGEGACDTLDKILKGGVAMLDELSELQFELKTICPQLSGHPIDAFRITKHPVRALGHAWALQKGAPYRAALDYYTGLVLSAGLHRKWFQDETLKARAHTFHYSREIKEQHFRPLTLLRFSPIIIIFGAGVFCSVLCFGIEILYCYFVRRKNPIFKKIRK